MPSVDDPLGRLLLARQLASAASSLALSMRNPSPSVPSAAPALEVREKSGAVDLVTSADVACQELIFRGLRARYPSHRLIGEEDIVPFDKLDDRPTWIVDAIDGTTNYLAGSSEWAVSIAYAENAQVHLAVVYAAEKGDVYVAVRGRGAWKNDTTLQVNQHPMHQGLVISEWGYQRGKKQIDTIMDVNKRLLQMGVRGIRQLGCGSLDMCYVAEGVALGAYCGVAGEGWKIWDYAAASLVVEEAGGQLRNVRGGVFDIQGDSMVAGGMHTVNAILDAING